MRNLAFVIKEQLSHICNISGLVHLSFLSNLNLSSKPLKGTLFIYLFLYVSIYIYKVALSRYRMPLHGLSWRKKYMRLDTFLTTLSTWQSTSDRYTYDEYT